MKIYNLKNMIKGWIIGNFVPSLYNCDYEVGVKKYVKGDKEGAHFHKLAIEFTVIISGIVKMNGTIYKADDIIEISRNEITDFECIEDAVTVVIKTVSNPSDKYMV